MDSSLTSSTPSRHCLAHHGYRSRVVRSLFLPPPVCGHTAILSWFALPVVSTMHSIRFPFQRPSKPDCTDPHRVPAKRGGAIRIRTTKTDALPSALHAEDTTTPRDFIRTVPRSSAGQGKYVPPFLGSINRTRGG